MISTGLTVAERRQHPRFKVFDVAVVVGERRLGHIVDMSLGGLSFDYICEGRRNENPVELGIVFGPNGHYLDKLPACLVCESVLSKRLASSAVIAHRRSMQFVGLSEEQKKDVARFIKKHARKALSDFQ